MECSVVTHKGEHQDVRLIEERIRWGKAVRSGFGTGYSGRPYAACKECRRVLRLIRHRRWKYSDDR
jgi:hypothetical protein